MKHRDTLGVASVLALLTAILLVSLAPALARGGNTNRTRSGLVPLSEAEAARLTYMREEEKLARDVYLEMDSLYSGVSAIFSNIAESEQQHMDTMKKMIDKYGIPDPVTDDSVGTIHDEELKEKYDTLIALGEVSYIDGLIAGATIEEIDMVDLQVAISVSETAVPPHPDLVSAYENLLEGSKNHLRAFVAALATEDVTYTPQYISQELFNVIINP